MRFEPRSAHGHEAPPRLEQRAARVITLLPLRDLELPLNLRRLGQARGLALAPQQGPVRLLLGQGAFGRLLLGKARTVLRTQARGR